MPWLALVGLGAFHGVNPAMGWLFAVALGLHRGDRGLVCRALIPIALGHAASIAIVALAVLLAGAHLPSPALNAAAGVLLLAWAAYHVLYGSRHRVRFGFRVSMLGLGLWSFSMATAHGAGLMLVPALMPLTEHGAPGHAGQIDVAGSMPTALLAVVVHTAAMVAMTGTIATLVYNRLGLAFLRQRWINLDWIWSAALALTGFLLIGAAASAGAVIR